MKNKPLNKHDLIAILRSFSPKELKRFTLYLGSEYFNTRKALRILLEKLLEFHPLYTDVNCTKEALYKEVYPDLEYNGGTMRDLLSSLYEAAADFITIESHRDKYSNKYNRINELRQRGLPRQAFKCLNELLQNDFASFKVDSEYFWAQYNLLIEKVNLGMIFKSHSKQKIINTLIEDVRNSELSILLFAILEITANYSNIILIESRFHESNSEELMKRTLKDFHKSGLFRLVQENSKFGFIAKVYIAMVEALLNKGNFALYAAYRDLVNKYTQKFSNDELSMHYSKLINCCIRGAKLGRHKSEFDMELTSLYLIFLENGYYKDNKTLYIPANLYRAIVLHAVKMNNLSWLKKVIGKFANDLQPADVDNMRNYAMAFYYFASGRSGEAIETIGKLNITQFIFKYDVYNLKLRIYYENREFNAALELIHSYRQFLKSDKLMPASRKMFHRTYMKYAARLIAITDGSNKYEAGLEVKRLEKENCVNKEWLIEKLSLFDKRRRKYSFVS